MFRVVLIFLVLCTHIGLIWSVVTQTPSVISPLHYDTAYGIGRAEDFNAVYHAAVNVQRDQSPYRKNEDGITPYFQAFRYLPIVAIAGQGMLFLSPRAAYLVWVAILEVLLGFLVYGFYKRIQNPWVRDIACLLLLVNSPYLLEVHMGQFTFATLALCALTLLFSTGPVLYVIAVLLKVFPLVIIPAFVRHRNYWVHGILAIFFGVALSVPYFVQDPSTWTVFFRRNFMLTAGWGSGNYGLVQLLYLAGNDLAFSFLMNHLDSVINAFRTALFIIVAVIVVLSRKDNPILGACTLLLTHFVSYQHVWEHHMSGVIVIAALLLVVWEDQKWLVTIGLASMILLALPTPFALFDITDTPSLLDPTINWPRFASYMIVLPKAIPVLVLFLLCIFDLCKEGLESPFRAIANAGHFSSSRYPTAS
jgi:hypothetical protein